MTARGALADTRHRDGASPLSSQTTFLLQRFRDNLFILQSVVKGCLVHAGDAQGLLNFDYLACWCLLFNFKMAQTS